MSHRESIFSRKDAKACLGNPAPTQDGTAPRRLWGDP